MTGLIIGTLVIRFDLHGAITRAKSLPGRHGNLRSASHKGICDA